MTPIGFAVSDDVFDAVTFISFGLRNVANQSKGAAGNGSVTRTPGGRLLVREFSTPTTCCSPPPKNT